MNKTRTWILSTVGAVLGGGIAGASAAMFDPSKYTFPQDFGTGKLWPFFFTGAGLTAAGMALHSPIGQRVLTGVKQSQEQIEQTKQDMQQAKDTLRQGSGQQSKKPPGGQP